MDQSSNPNTIQLPVKQGEATVYATVDACDAWALDRCWHMRGERAYAYPARSTKLGGKNRKHYLHREILGLGAFDGVHMVDHIDGDRLNCRRSNLRIVSNSQNQQNRQSARKDSRTGVRGVVPHPGGGFRVFVANGTGQPQYVGTRKQIEEATALATQARAEAGYLNSGANP